MQDTRLRFTYRDYLLLPEGDRRELIEGDFHVVPAPSIRHQTVAANLGTLLRELVRRNRLGIILWAPTDVVLSPETVVQPDRAQLQASGHFEEPGHTSLGACRRQRPW
jgi:Uma2 family endonuclease